MSVMTGKSHLQSNESLVGPLSPIQTDRYYRIFLVSVRKNTAFWLLLRVGLSSILAIVVLYAIDRRFLRIRLLSVRRMAVLLRVVG